MTIYSINHLMSDLKCNESLKTIHAKISANYTKQEFHSDLTNLFISDIEKAQKIASQIFDKVRLVHREKAILFLAEKYYSGEFPHLPIVEKDQGNGDVVRALCKKQYDEKIQKLVNRASKLKGYPTFPKAMLGIAAGAVVFSSMIPALASGAVAALVFKAYKLYQELGGPPDQEPQLPKSPLLRQRTRRS